ncbi:Lrp/AsnC family transcriptional regulator [Streptomyces sp. NBC_01262]|jgi:DNA-binding Lrp family transcriptional regulator|uniref:Lrp/AsnC family transcriptional regulator n=1 Tax=Streptomyces sp. NBC_01262 TaxID=2903803 RepID=UPI002E3808B2|nr:Lrp/AsnC family transcriptional regulator [Streptomyces sp. NBC_01262]
MDAIDRAILRELQADGRLTNQELAARVGLTPSPCLRRVRQLEEDGVIRGYRAVVDPVSVRRGFEVFVTVEVRNDRDSVDAFETALQAIPDIVEAYRLYGTPGCLLRVAVADSAAFERFWHDTLITLPGVNDVNSQLVMTRIKSPEGVPVA